MIRIKCKDSFFYIYIFCSDGSNPAKEGIKADDTPNNQTFVSKHPTPYSQHKQE